VGRGAGASERHRGHARRHGVWGIGREWWPLLPSLPSRRWSPSIPSHSQKSGFELLRGSYWAAGRHGLGHGLERDVAPTSYPFGNSAQIIYLPPSLANSAQLPPSAESFFNFYIIFSPIYQKYMSIFFLQKCHPAASSSGGRQVTPDEPAAGAP